MYPGISSSLTDPGIFDLCMNEWDVAAGGLIETYSDVNENLDISDVLGKEEYFCFNS